MTRAEYQERAMAALGRIEDLTVRGQQVTIVIALALLVWIWIFHLGAQGTASAYMAYGMAAAGIFFAAFWRNFLWKPVSRQFDLMCPACEASLLKPKFVTISVVEVLRSGKCQRCGVEVLSGDLPPPRPLSVVRRIRSLPGAVLAWVGLVVFFVSVRRVNHDYCTSRYAAARSADDSADVDDLELPVDLSRHHSTTCGGHRR